MDRRILKLFAVYTLGDFCWKRYESWYHQISLEVFVLSGELDIHDSKIRSWIALLQLILFLHNAVDEIQKKYINMHNFRFMTTFKAQWYDIKRVNWNRLGI
jgi:hypothetical protein